MQGSLVKAYLYKAEWKLTYSGSSGAFKLRVGNEETANIDVSIVPSELETALEGLSFFSSGDVSVSGSSSPVTITLTGDYAFSGIPFEIASADSGVTVSIARSFPSSPLSLTEANGFYTMGLETNFEKSRDQDTQDITNKESGRFKETVSQTRTITLNADYFYLTTANYEKLKNQYELGYSVVICDVSPHTTTTNQDLCFSTCNITSLSKTASYNEVVAFTASFEVTGEPTTITD